MSSDFVGKSSEEGQLFRNVDLRGKSASYVCQWLSYTKPVAFYELVKAISRGNRSVESKILRSWGIRREDVEAALPYGSFRLSDVSERADDQGCSDW